MFRKIPVVNKLVQEKTIQRTRQSHLRRLSSTRNRQSQALEEEPHQLNQRKKQLQIQEKFTQIERENRLLLQKITTIMSKRKNHRDKQSANSLNWSFRKRQLRGIEKENFKMLKRLQSKRSDYQVNKLNRQWKRNKQLIQIHSEFPKSKRQSRAVSSYAKSTERQQENVLFAGELLVDQRQFKIEIVQSRKCLSIWGWDVMSKDYKVIQIPSKQGWRLIDSEFEGDVSRMTERLRYCDGKLYLFAKGEMHDQS